MILKPIFLGMLASGLVLPLPASAHIICNGTFQVLTIGEISTPYCQDEDLAKEARGRGIPVTGAAVRKSSSLKAVLCVDAQTAPACANDASD
jgi:hypothetical protein